MPLVGVPATLTFTRPSRTRPGEVHTITVDGQTLAPTGCTCPAGEKGMPCWASLEVMVVEVLAQAGYRYVISASDDNRAEAEELLREVLERAFWAKSIAMASRTRPCWPTSPGEV